MNTRIKPQFKVPRRDVWKWWALAGLWCAAELFWLVCELVLFAVCFALPVIALFGVIFVLLYRDIIRAFLETLQ